MMTTNEKTIEHPDNIVRIKRPYDIPWDYRTVDPFKWDTVKDILETVCRTNPDGIVNLSVEPTGEYDAIISFGLYSFSISDIGLIIGMTQGITVTPMDCMFYVDLTIEDFYCEKVAKYK